MTTFTIDQHMKDLYHTIQQKKREIECLESDDHLRAAEKDLVDLEHRLGCYLCFTIEELPFDP